jgi:hypothetical protein
MNLCGTQITLYIIKVKVVYLLLNQGFDNCYTILIERNTILLQYYSGLQKQSIQLRSNLMFIYFFFNTLIHIIV